MKRVFADTAYFVALVRRRDQLHRQAVNQEEHLPGKLLTTEWILTEVANKLADPPAREEFIRLLARRKDKDWSLTDCISFFVMSEYGIDSALTSDEDFEQAGFQRLMEPGPQGVREPAFLYGREPLEVCQMGAGSHTAEQIERPIQEISAVRRLVGVIATNC